MTLWVRWMKPVKPAITLNTENEEDAEDLEHTEDDMPFNSVITEIFSGDGTEELIQHMFAHINTQVVNPPM